MRVFSSKSANPPIFSSYSPLVSEVSAHAETEAMIHGLLDSCRRKGWGNKRFKISIKTQDRGKLPFSTTSRRKSDLIQDIVIDSRQMCEPPRLCFLVDSLAGLCWVSSSIQHPPHLTPTVITVRLSRNASHLTTHNVPISNVTTIKTPSVSVSG